MPIYLLGTNDVHHQLGLADLAQLELDELELHAYAESASYSNVMHGHNLTRDFFNTPDTSRNIDIKGTFKITRIIPISKLSLYNCGHTT